MPSTKKTPAKETRNAADNVQPEAPLEGMNTLMPGAPPFTIALILTLLSYQNKWCTRMGWMNIYPELSEEICSPLLGLMVGIMASRLIREIAIVVRQNKLHKIEEDKKQKAAGTKK